MSHFHAVVWIDHLHARIFHVGLTGVDGIVLHPQSPERHIHHKANTIGSGHVHDDTEYLARVAAEIAGAGAIMIIGPAGSKDEFAGYLRRVQPAVADKIVAMESSDHPSDREIVALARRHFRLETPRSVRSAGV